MAFGEYDECYVNHMTFWDVMESCRLDGDLYSHGPWRYDGRFMVASMFMALRDPSNVWW